MESQGPPAEGPSVDGLDAFQVAIGYHFRDIELLRTALTHSSFVAENDGFESYERLEFLGDAVLELLTTEIIFSLMPDATEGDMTKVRASVVDVLSLADIARQINVGSVMYLGVGESRSGGSDRDSLLSDVVESVLGAIFIDGGIASAKHFVAAHWNDRVVSSIEATDVTDSRSLLQEHLARTGRTVSFTYERTGPDHAAVYRATALVNGDRVGEGSGSSKKTAAIAASADALNRNTSM
jgi:ribonuclease-3